MYRMADSDPKKFENYAGSKQLLPFGHFAEVGNLKFEI